MKSSVIKLAQLLKIISSYGGSDGAWFMPGCWLDFENFVQTSSSMMVKIHDFREKIEKSRFLRIQPSDLSFLLHNRSLKCAVSDSERESFQKIHWTKFEWPKHQPSGDENLGFEGKFSILLKFRGDQIYLTRAISGAC